MLIVHELSWAFHSWDSFRDELFALPQKIFYVFKLKENENKIFFLLLKKAKFKKNEKKTIKEALFGDSEICQALCIDFAVRMLRATFSIANSFFEVE